MYPFVPVLTYYFFITLRTSSLSAPDSWNVIHVEDNLPSLQGFSSISCLCVLHLICLLPVRKAAKAFGSWRAEYFILSDVTASAQQQFTKNNLFGSLRLFFFSWIVFEQIVIVLDLLIIQNVKDFEDLIMSNFMWVFGIQYSASKAITL